MAANRSDHLEPLLDALEALQRLLTRFNNQGVIIGGAAVSILGRARFTDDVDAMFLLSSEELPRLLEMAKEEGIEPRIENAVDFARKNRVLLLRHTVTDTRIDISLGALPFEEEMVERSVLHEVDEALQLRLSASTGFRQPFDKLRVTAQTPAQRKALGRDAPSPLTPLPWGEGS